MDFSWSPFSRPATNLVPVTTTVAAPAPVQVASVPMQRVIYEPAPQPTPAPAPTTTTTTVTTTPVQTPTTFNACHMRLFGLILALLAATTLSLGIADVVTTYYNYNCGTAGTCSVTAEPYVWTWVASAIWGSIPIFFAGLAAMCLGRNPAGWIRMFALLIFLSAVVFAPAIIVLTAIELWRGSAAMPNFYTAALAVGSIPAPAAAVSAKFGIPLAIVILAAIMFVMCAIMMMALCCCTHWLGIYYQAQPTAAPVVATTAPAPQPAPAPVPVAVQPEYFYYPARPQIRAPVLYQPAGPVLATRYNSVMPSPYGGGALYGNFPARPASLQPTSFLGDFFTS